MARSIKKGPYVHPKLARKIEKLNESGEKRIIRTWARRSMVTPDMLGHTLHVHNGKLFMPVFVTEDMVGHRLGEFAPTRRQTAHAGDRKIRRG
ncbi:MAG: 30S ribosomal protein S19 [Myxococcota bacterium]